MICSPPHPLLVIDVPPVFLSLMKEKEVKSLVLQIQMTYSYLRKSEKDLQCIVCGAGEESVVGRRLRIVACGATWPSITLESRQLEEIWSTPAARSKLVYLTAESDRTLTEVVAAPDAGPVLPYQDWPTLVVGGFVDKNRHPGRAHARALELDIPTARLPLRDYWDIKCKTVMAVNHLTEVVVRLAATQDWVTAMANAFPPRRGAKRKHEQSSPLTDDPAGTDTAPEVNASAPPSPTR
uniref:tRNA (guanine(9)-N(1))-methyltransferase n=1 Tax=Sexangularia sp. CB-2014 TaxID=1486929 RepID=A0A7S1YJX9_9EUKA|mmetsp:Transcript_6567/g.21266  ORF Transcript_6567/g.21266 Transcript_6567/m.21266 type:complete len:238 (+) Transcript_6567:18-731(+)